MINLHKIVTTRDYSDIVLVQFWFIARKCRNAIKLKIDKNDYSTAQKNDLVKVQFPRYRIDEWSSYYLAARDDIKEWEKLGKPVDWDWINSKLIS